MAGARRIQRSTLVRAAFGLPIDRGEPARRAQAVRRRARHDAHALAPHLEPGTAALVTGPSGAGKSLLLAALAARLGGVAVEPVRPRVRRAPVDLIEAPMPDALTLLSRLGLADARRLVTPGGRLSEGERARLALAVAYNRARRTRAPAIIADEFASTLDRHTAFALAAAARRALPAGACLVAATARDEIAAPLRPDTLVYIPLEAPAEIHRKGRSACALHQT